MEFFRKHILLTLAAFCLFLASCEKNSREPMPSAEGYKVTFVVSAGENGTFTRALTEEDDSGSGYENYLDVSKLRILFFSKENVFMEEFTPETVTPVDDSAYPQEWELSGPLKTAPITNFKVVVLANWRGDVTLEKGTTTIEDICEDAASMCESLDFPFVPSATNTIPMFGVKTISGDIEFRKNLITDLGTIDLLRSVAKVVVRKSADITDEIESLTLKNYNKGLACAPLGMYDNTRNLPYSNSVHLVGGSEDNDTDSKSLAFTEGDDCWILYVPEYRNIDPASGLARSDKSSIEISFKNIDKTYTIDFRDYGTSTGNYFNIVRNHVYDFTVNSVGAYDLTLTLIAQPWEFEKFDVDYKKTVGTTTDGQIKWTDGNHITPISDNRVLANNAGDLVCQFTIASPVGAQWYAVFEEKSGDLNHFRFGGKIGDSEYDYEHGFDSVSGVVDGNPVTITIKQNAETVGSAKLVIYASYGNINFDTSTVLGGPYVISKD
jgi:hypothetical protein